MLAGEVDVDRRSPGQLELSQLIFGELPLGVVRRACNQSAAEERLGEPSLKGEDLADLDVGILLLAVKLPVGGGGEADGPLLVEVHRRPHERLVGPHAFADVVAAAALVPSRRRVQLKPGADVRPRGMPAQVERPQQQVGDAGIDGPAKRESRRFDRRVRERKHRHRAVVGPQNFGLAHVPRQRSSGSDRDAAWSARRGADDTAVSILDGVGVVAQVEERSIEPRLRLRSGLHAEIAGGMAAVQLRLRRYCEEQRQPACNGGHHQSSHSKTLLSQRSLTTNITVITSPHCRGRAGAGGRAEVRGRGPVKLRGTSREPLNPADSTRP